MSRIPYGVCFCYVFFVHGCVSLITPAVQAPVVGSPSPMNHSDARGQSEVLPQNNQEVLPENLPGLVNPQDKNSPAFIDLGEPQSLPVSSDGPLTVNKIPGQSQNSQTTGMALSFSELHSTSGKPVELKLVGNGNMRILVLGSLYGNEPESLELMDSLARAAEKYAQSPSYSFLLVKTPNPDGVVERIRTNTNGVDLNRNFPSTWFTANPNRLTGSHPASEVETKNVMKLLAEFQPHRVIHVRSSIGQRPLLLLNEQCSSAKEEIQLQTVTDIGTFSGQYKAGSLEEFVTVRQDTELMTVLLPPKGFEQLKVDDLFQLATMVIGEQPGSTPEQQSTQDSIAKTTPGPASSTPAMPAARNILEPDGEKGFVELLPPPPGQEKFNRASQQTTPDDPKYYELPPPPM